MGKGLNYLLSLLILLCYCCNNNNNINIKTEEGNYKIVSDVDSVYFFYKKGGIDKIISYYSETDSMVFYDFYSNQYLNSIVPSIKGKRHGTAIWYYDNGMVQSIVDWVNNRQVGKMIEYSEEGLIERYAFIKREGLEDPEIIFDRFYDGDSIKEKGIPFSLELNQGEYREGDSLKIELFVFVPPTSDFEVYWGIGDENLKQVKSNSRRITLSDFFTKENGNKNIVVKIFETDNFSNKVNTYKEIIQPMD